MSGVRPTKSPDDPTEVVQILMSEENARAIEEKVLKPRGLNLTGPVLFDEDTTPTYIIGINYP